MQVNLEHSILCKPLREEREHEKSNKTLVIGVYKRKFKTAVQYGHSQDVL